MAASIPTRTSSVWTFFRDSRFTTLFVTDMWERFSFYGMQALLFLYAVAPPSEGGLGLGVGTSGALFGLYMSAVFVSSLPGGWVGDRLLGPRRALLIGALSIAAGHYCLAVPLHATFYLGLTLIALGTGLVKPNMAALFGVLYPRASSSQREAAFTVFYMSIQVSALIGPLVTGLLGERVNWHLGFGVAAVGMTLGILRYLAGVRQMGDLGNQPPHPWRLGEHKRALRRAGYVVGAVLLLVAIDGLAGTFAIEHVLGVLGLGTLVAPFLYFRYLRRRPSFSEDERDRIRAYLWVFLPSALFWMMYSQLGSSFAFFAREHTDRDVLGFVVPASWFQSAHPLFVLVVAPLSAWLWMRLGARAGASVKLAGGLVTSGLGFLIMAGAALAIGEGAQVSPVWLLLAFLAQACGELAFGPVGLSVTSEIAPRGYRSQLLGLYFLGAALGAGVGGQFARLLDVIALSIYFGAFAVLGLFVGGLLAARARHVDTALSGGERVESASRGPRASVGNVT